MVLGQVLGGADMKPLRHSRANALRLVSILIQTLHLLVHHLTLFQRLGSTLQVCAICRFLTRSSLASLDSFHSTEKHELPVMQLEIKYAYEAGL